MTFWEILLIILLVVLAVLVVMYFVGRRLQKKQADASVQMDAMKQVVSMLIIDKKLMKIKQSGLPQMVIDQTPKYLRWTKLPIVKAKVGPKIMVLAADRSVWDVLPIKQEVKVEVSGIYIMSIKSVRGGSIQPPAKKKGFFARFRKNKDEKAGKGSKKK